MSICRAAIHASRSCCRNCSCRRPIEDDSKIEEMRLDDSRLAEIFAREVLAMLVRKELLSPEWAERILSWPHSGFNVHSRMFIARVTSHIPDKGQVTVRYSGLYANAHRGKVKKASQSPTALRVVEEELRRLPSKGWAAMIRKVYEVDPMICSKCGGRMKIGGSIIVDFQVS